LAEQVALGMVWRLLLQLMDPFLQRMNALILLLQSFQQRYDENTRKSEAAAADQFQQHATSRIRLMLT
tara:strand:- start:76 stop:279 length:204 start_codon:yes stop_codon:yes gene_type:complete